MVHCTLWSAAACAFVRVEFLRLRQGASKLSKLAHPRRTPQESRRSPSVPHAAGPGLSGYAGHAGSWKRALPGTSPASAVVRKNVAPASSRQTVLLTQKQLSRLTCRRDAGATILSHDLRLCGEGFWVAAMPICVHLCSSVVSFCATERA